MRTLADVVNMQKNAVVDLEKCVIVKENKNGTFNITCTIDGKKVFINYINVALCKDNKLFVEFGKKEKSWTKEYWYQVEPVVEEEVK